MSPAGGLIFDGPPSGPLHATGHDPDDLRAQALIAAAPPPCGASAAGLGLSGFWAGSGVDVAERPARSSGVMCRPDRCSAHSLAQAHADRCHVAKADGGLGSLQISHHLRQRQRDGGGHQTALGQEGTARRPMGQGLADPSLVLHCRPGGLSCHHGRSGGYGQAVALGITPLASSSVCNSPDWNISVTMSQPPTNSPFT